MLPLENQDLAYELVKKLMLGWDPDFTKLISAEKNELDKEINKAELLSHSEVDWS